MLGQGPSERRHLFYLAKEAANSLGKKDARGGATTFKLLFFSSKASACGCVKGGGEEEEVGRKIC